MTKKVTKITVYKMSEKNEKHLKSLKEAEELIRSVLMDEDVCDNWYGYDRLEELYGDLQDVQKGFELSFTEEETEEVEEIID